MKPHGCKKLADDSSLDSLPNAIVAFADFSKNNVSEILRCNIKNIKTPGE
jgi:hypothetical protein